MAWWLIPSKHGLNTWKIRDLSDGDKTSRGGLSLVFRCPLQGRTGAHLAELPIRRRSEGHEKDLCVSLIMGYVPAVSFKRRRDERRRQVLCCHQSGDTLSKSSRDWHLQIPEELSRVTFLDSWSFGGAPDQGRMFGRKRITSAADTPQQHSTTTQHNRHTVIVKLQACMY